MNVRRTAPKGEGMDSPSNPSLSAINTKVLTGHIGNTSYGIDKLTNEGGLGYHDKWCFSMDREIETPH